MYECTSMYVLIRFGGMEDGGSDGGSDGVGWSRMESDGGSEKGWRREGSALEPMRRSFSGG